MALPTDSAEFSLQIVHSAVSRKAFITGQIWNPGSMPSTPVAVANAILGAFASSAADFDTSVTLGPVTGMCDIGGVESPMISTAATLSGTSSISSPPPNVAVLIKKTTGAPGRRFRGRWYMPWFVPENEIDEAGVISSTALTGMQTRLNATLAAFSANDVSLALLGNVSNPPQLVTALTAERTVATQRRRLGKRS